MWQNPGGGLLHVVEPANRVRLRNPIQAEKPILRTSIIPVATSIAFSVPSIFTGAVMTERIFAWQGMGTYFIETINRNDINGAVAVATVSGRTQADYSGTAWVAGSVSIDAENDVIIANGTRIQVIYSDDPTTVDYSAHGIEHAQPADAAIEEKDAQRSFCTNPAAAAPTRRQVSSKSRSSP